MNIKLRNFVIDVMATVNILCVTFGCKRAKAPDYHVFDDAAYRVNVFTSRLEGEIVQHFGKPDREVLGSLLSGLSAEARMPLGLAKLPEDTMIKEWWYFRNDAFGVVWMSRNDKDEWVSVADFSQGPGLDYFLWLREEPEGLSYYEHQHTGWTDEDVVAKFGKPHQDFSNYNRVGLWHVKQAALTKGRDYMKIENPEMKEYYYNRTNEHVQSVFWFVKDSNSVWKVVYDMTLRDGIIL